MCVFVCVCVQVVQRDVETQAAVEEMDLKALELERQRVQLQHQLARCQEEVRAGHTDMVYCTVWFSLFLTPSCTQMLLQLDMEESADNRCHSLHCEQLEREVGEEGDREKGRLAAAQASLATTQARQNCMETVREVDRRRREVDESRREELAQVSVGVCNYC